MKSKQGKVPCNGCTECCKNDVIRILDHEDASQWETMPHPIFIGKRALKMGDNGSCVYLGEKGCTINKSKPALCKSFDCRVIVIAYMESKEVVESAIENGSISKNVVNKGVEMQKKYPIVLMRRF